MRHPLLMDATCCIGMRFMGLHWHTHTHTRSLNREQATRGFHLYRSFHFICLCIFSHGHLMPSVFVDKGRTAVLQQYLFCFAHTTSQYNPRQLHGYKHTHI